MAVQIAIKDPASAKQWLGQVMDVNEAYYTAMEEAGQTLQDAKDFGEGTMVDELYNLGTDLMRASQKVFNTINEISSTVNTVLEKVTDLTNVVTGAINVVKGIFG